MVGLEVGADDYVTKPFVLRELVARVRAVLRRLESEAPAAAVADGLRFEGCALELGARRLMHRQGHEVALTAGEFALLAALVQGAGRVLSRDFLLERTRGREGGPFDRTIDVQIGRLRKKLEVDAGNPRLIKSARGAGYVSVPKVQRA